MWKIPAALALIAGAFALGRFTAPEKTATAGRLALPAAESASDKAAAPSSHPAGPKSTPAPDTARARSALAQLDQGAPSEQREDERLKLLSDWAATDPVGAMEYAKQHLKGDRLAQAMAGIATEWAKQDPAAAWTWAISLGPDQSHHAHTVMEQVARNDPVTAARFAAEYARQQPDDAVGMCLTAMRGMTYNGNFDAARKLAVEIQLRSSEEQSTLLNFMAGQWARYEPEKAAQWVLSLPPGDPRNQALIGLGESWADLDPPRAADFAAQLPEGQVRQTALRQAIANWILTDPEKASTWINQFKPHEDFDQAVASVATMRFLVEEHVDTALNWASTIFNEPLRVAATSEILSQWYQRDRSAALSYVQTAPGLSAEARDQILRQLHSGD